MARLILSIPDPVKEWIDAQIKLGDYATASDYVLDLVQRDRDHGEQGFTLDSLQKKLNISRRSGVSKRSVNEIFAEAQAITTPHPHS